MSYPPYPEKKRPSAAWFGLGIALIVASVVAGFGLLIWTFSGFVDAAEASFYADGKPHEVQVGTDGDRMLWRAGAGPCRVVDLEGGGPVALERPGGTFRRADSLGNLRGAYRFDPGSGHLSVACRPRGSMITEAGIGPAPHTGRFLAGIVATVLVPGLLGLAGVVVLIVTGILWSIRPAQPAGGQPTT